MSHPFGDLVTHHLHRKHGLSQNKLAEAIGLDPAIIAAMCHGRRLTGKTARPRVIQIIQWFQQEGLLTLRTEADALLTASGMVGVQEDDPCDLTKLCACTTPRTTVPTPYLAPALPPQGVLGRDALLHQITTLLRLDDPPAANLPPVVLRGMGGIGKTTLAAAIGRAPDIPTHFPDGVLWVALGPTPMVRPLLDGWGQALGLELAAEADEAACRLRLQSLLYPRRLLLVIDDVWDAAAAEAFLVGGPHCRTLITTRETPIACALTIPAQTVTVDLLTPAAASELLYRLAPDLHQVDHQLALELCRRLEYLPLALTLAGRALALEATVPSRLQGLLTELIERRAARLQLLEAKGRLGIEQAEVSLRAILGLSVDRLSPADRVYFAMLSVFGGEPLTWDQHAAAYVWACAPDVAEGITARLIQRGLVEERQERYWIHALLADYAEELRAELGL